MTQVTGSNIPLSPPLSWGALTPAQYKYICRLTAAGAPSEELPIRALINWGDLRYLHPLGEDKGVFRTADGAKVTITHSAIASAAAHLAYLATPPDIPMRPDKLAGHPAAAAPDFQGAPFELYLYCNNLFAGVITSEEQSDALLTDLTLVLYPGIKREEVQPWHRCAILFWISALKMQMARQFRYLYSGGAGSEEGNIAQRLNDLTNAQIRALTKGDITKEEIILKADTWRALAELDAQAREYAELKKQQANAH